MAYDVIQVAFGGILTPVWHGERMRRIFLLLPVMAVLPVSGCSTGKAVRAVTAGAVQLVDEVNEEFRDPDERDMVVETRVKSWSPLVPSVIVTEPCSVDPVKRKDEAHLPRCPE